MKVWKYRGFEFREMDFSQTKRHNWPYTWELWYQGEKIGRFSHGLCQYKAERKRIVNMILGTRYPKAVRTISYRSSFSAEHAVLYARDAKGIVVKAAERIRSWR